MNRYCLGIVVALSTCASVNAADISSDGSTATNVISSPDGSIKVTIAPASQDGTSLNRFSNFSVGANGATLDNTSSKSKLIINEVTGTSKSAINGTIGITGQKAAVIIANPNGISVNGGRFKNTNGIVLSTGKVGTSSGVQLDVSTGEVTIEGQGVDTDGATLGIIANRAVIDGNINTGEGDISIVSGNSEADVSLTDGGTIELQSRAVGVVAPTDTSSVVISSGAILKGGAIRLQSLNAGAGVNQNGDIAAGSFQISANGKVSLAGNIEAQNAVSISGSEVEIGRSGITKINSATSGVRIRSKSGNVTIKNVELGAIKRDNNSFAALGGVSVESAGDLTFNADSGLQNTIGSAEDGAGFTARGAISVNNTNIQASDKIIVSAGRSLDIIDSSMAGGSVSVVSAGLSTLQNVEMISVNGVSIDASAIGFIGTNGQQTSIKSQQEGITLVSRDGDINLQNTRLEAAAVTAGDSANAAAITIISANDIMLNSTTKSNATQFKTTTDGVSLTSLGGIQISNSTLEIGGDFDVTSSGTFETKTKIDQGAGEKFTHSSGFIFGSGFTANIDYGKPTFDDFRNSLLISGQLNLLANQWENYGSVIEAKTIKANINEDVINQSVLTGTAHFERSCFFICSASGSTNTGLIEGKIYASDGMTIATKGNLLTTGAILASNLDLSITAKTFVADSTLTPNIVLHKSGIFGFAGLRDGWIGYGYDGGFVGSFFGNFDVIADSITYSGVTPFSSGELNQSSTPIIFDIPKAAKPIFNYHAGYLAGILR